MLSLYSDARSVKRKKKRQVTSFNFRCMTKFLRLSTSWNKSWCRRYCASLCTYFRHQTYCQRVFMNVLYGSISARCPPCDFSPRIRITRSDRICAPHFKRESYLNRLGPTAKKETAVCKRKELLKHLLALAVDPCRPVSSKAVQWQTRKREKTRDF